MAQLGSSDTWQGNEDNGAQQLGMDNDSLGAVIAESTAVLQCSGSTELGIGVKADGSEDHGTIQWSSTPSTAVPDQHQPGAEEDDEHQVVQWQGKEHASSHRSCVASNGGWRQRSQQLGVSHRPWHKPLGRAPHPTKVHEDDTEPKRDLASGDSNALIPPDRHAVRLPHHAGEFARFAHSVPSWSDDLVPPDDFEEHSSSSSLQLANGMDRSDRQGVRIVTRRRT